MKSSIYCLLTLVPKKFRNGFTSKVCVTSPDARTSKSYGQAINEFVIVKWTNTNSHCSACVQGRNFFHDSTWKVFAYMKLNLVINSTDKLSSKYHDLKEADHVLDFLSSCMMIPLKNQGTWCNKRYNDHLVMEQLDKAFINETWLDMFPHTQVQDHLISVSDHGVLTIDLFKNLNF